MTLETIRISVLDDTISPAPVDGVVVRFFDSTGTTLITEATTGAVDPGTAEVTLDAEDPAVVYQLRFFKAGLAIRSPLYIDALSPPPLAGNNFEVTATVFTLPVATDPLLCRCSGFVRGANGHVKRGVDLNFILQQNPVMAGADVVLGERIDVRSDSIGFVSTDLLRGASYYATVEGHQDVQREVLVPDRSSLNIGHLLFPIVARITYDVVLSVPVNDDLEVVPTVTATDYRVLWGTADADLSYSTDDESIATVSVEEDKLVIHGISAGTTILRVERLDPSLTYSPDPGISGGATTITVTV